MDSSPESKPPTAEQAVWDFLTQYNADFQSGMEMQDSLYTPEEQGRRDDIDAELRQMGRAEDEEDVEETEWDLDFSPFETQEEGA